MRVRCRASTEDRDTFDLDFLQVPRIGEFVDIESSVDSPRKFRVTRVLHSVAPSATPSILLDVTSQIL